jgi:hypothetical protein
MQDKVGRQPACTPKSVFLLCKREAKRHSAALELSHAGEQAGAKS